MRDVLPPIETSQKISQNNLSLSYRYPKNVSINGTDYMQSQAPIGTFGGTLVDSTIGEGPKTFNPFNCKDNTSSIMAGRIYDGLISTHPITGVPVAKLAKDYNNCR